MSWQEISNYLYLDSSRTIKTSHWAAFSTLLQSKMQNKNIKKKLEERTRITKPISMAEKTSPSLDNTRSLDYSFPPNVEHLFQPYDQYEPLGMPMITTAVCEERRKNKRKFKDNKMQAKPSSTHSDEDETTASRR